MFRKLRGKLLELDIDHVYLASKLDISRATVSAKFNCRSLWNLDEMYTVMDLIQEPYDNLHEYFPKNGGGISTKRKAS
ncbi:Protein of unknown function [Sporobacter termitidis DSM 10068]|uniref:Cro/C1-type HTH DNA-binding domain-containing protein n=1 Tax=Sporobacter termitidis DSM 10068 TaxID=1123282 RepID=A0A1M5YNK0_9FIRM|nr:DUF739 family protein [Sporobacter termitidis]SHI13675.1 Protein of unknown function [Sporobacter termitidis DSM 10068]